MIDLNKIKAAAEELRDAVGGPDFRIKEIDFHDVVGARVTLEMVALIERQERELAEARAVAPDPLPQGWREALQAEKAAQEKHYGEAAACAAVGSKLYAGERDCTEGVIMGVGYAIDRLEELAAAQPALNEEALRDAVAESISTLYGCGRVWSAWHVGTMTEDDFYSAGECDECIDQVMDAIRPHLAPLPATPSKEG